MKFNMPFCFVGLLALVLLFAPSCRKHTKGADTVVADSIVITCAGGFFARSPITFSANAPKGATYSWDFGDSLTSADSTPIHSYSTSGTYTVTLLVNNTQKSTLRLTLDPAVVISSTGQRIMGHNLNFSSTAAGATAYLWDFGDGTTATGATPSHPFAAEGTYTVSLTLNSAPSPAARYVLKVTVDPLYTYLMGGLRNWHDTLYFTKMGGAHDTTGYPDTTLGVQILDSLTVVFCGDTLFFQSRSGTNIRFFGYNGSYYYRILYDALANTIWNESGYSSLITPWSRRRFTF